MLTLFPTLSSLLNKKIIWVYLIFYVAAGIFSVGYHHVDEHFQILEFAGWKIDIPAILKWEYYSQIRPALQPTLVYLFYQVGEWFYGTGEVNPYHLTTFLRFFTLILHTFSLLLFLEVMLKNLTPSSRVIVLWLSVILWFLPYNAVRFSSENFSRIFFLFSLSLPFFYQGESGKKKSWIWLLAGVASGIAFFSRYQVALMTVGFFVWLLLIKKESWKYLFLFAMGVVIACVGNGMIDYWFYGEWVFTPWNYFQVNIMQGKANSFGTSPWYFYFILVAAYNIPFFPLLAIFPILFFFLYPRHILTWVTLPFLLVHFVIGHKELRFLFPLISYLPFFIVLVLDRWKWWQDSSRMKRIFVSYFFIINGIALMFASFRPADFSLAYYYKYIYSQGEKLIFLFNRERENSQGYYRQPITTAWYIRNDKFIKRSITNTDHLVQEIKRFYENQTQSLPSSIVLATPSPLVLKNGEISPEWKGRQPIPVPRWEYSFPFKGINDYPFLYHLLVKEASVPVVHFYSWEYQ